MFVWKEYVKIERKGLLNEPKQKVVKMLLLFGIVPIFIYVNG